MPGHVAVGPAPAGSAGGSAGHAPHRFAERLDRALGDPHDAGGVFSYRRSAELDRREEFPAEACAALDALGLHRYYVPAVLGGNLDDYETVLMLVRVLARRDFTVALAHAKTYLGAVCVWMGGDDAQARELATAVLDGAVVSLALTEPSHGSDLLAGDTVAERTPAGFRLRGDKWLINNATRARMICVLARTDPAGGPRGFSVLLVDKERLAPGTCTPIPPVATHGIRGADISGIVLRDAEVGADALVGAAGDGLEVVLKSLQITRTMCAAASLGMGDSALRLAVDFATRHELYGRRLIDLAQASRSLAVAYAKLLVAEAVALVSARSIHALPQELAVVSAVVKYWVPTTVDSTIASLGRVLGARALLVDDFADGRFQKVQRDHRIVAIFDGNTYVNLNALINQFPALVQGYRRGRVDAPGLRSATALDEPRPPFDRAGLRLVSRGGCSLVQGLPAAVEELLRTVAAGAATPVLAGLGRELRTVVDDLHERMAAHRPSPRDVPADAFTLAVRYTHVYAAAACLQLWLRSRDAARGEPAELLWGDGTWLAGCLSVLLAELRSPARPRPGEDVDRLLPALLEQYRAGRLFSLLSCDLVGEGEASDRDR